VSNPSRSSSSASYSPSVTYGGSDRKRAARQRAYRRSLRHVLAMAPTLDWYDGALWYRQALDSITDTATLYGMTPDAVAGIVAALSPRMRWEANIADAVRIISGRGQVRALGRNAVKARRILAGEDWRDVLLGPKVRAFAANLSGDMQEVTVDVWMARALTGGALSEPRSDGDYREMARAVRAVAGEYGLPPAVLQAVAWTAVRKKSAGVTSK